MSLNAVFGKALDHGVFGMVNQMFDTKAASTHIDHQISHQLAGAVISHLTAAVHRYHGNIPRR